LLNIAATRQRGAAFQSCGRRDVRSDDASESNVTGGGVDWELLSMIDRLGTPFSAALHVIERYRLIDGALAHALQQKHEHDYFPGGSPFSNAYGMGDIDPDARKPGLQVEITVDDPATFTTPWSGLVTYRPVLADWPQVACAENTQRSGSSWAVLVPQADKPDF
jgi:hypothetical protein